MSTSDNKAVFLSYASQDAEAARRICDALRPAGVEVWFDQSELRGGDAWDAKIRRQIKECALFVPIISANTNDRLEGYFRLSGDKARFEKEMFYQIDDSTTVGALRARYGRALLREDFAEAERLLEDAQLWSELTITRINPSLRLDAALSVHRAYLGLARSDPAAAKTHATEALKRLSREVQSDEEGYIIRVAMAEMMAIAGRGDDAVVAMKKVLAEITQRDPFEGMKHQHRLACVYAAAGMPREALEQLAKLMQQPCDAVPTELREEPMLGSLRALPEFERILTTARKL